ncbi:MAG: TetR/AcrR family transcriptional regulator [Myxococcota bacterium]
MKLTEQARDKKHPRGRPPTLSRESILKAAAEIPLPSFSVRAVAEMLNVSPQSIYYYFENRNALLGALAEVSVAQLPDMTATDWQSYFRESLLGYRRWLIASKSPALLPEINSSWARLNDQESEGLLLKMEAFVAFFIKAGFRPQEALEVWNLGTTLVVRSVVTRLGDREVQDHWHALRTDVGNLGAERFPALSGVLSEEPIPVEEWFGRIVDIAVAGVAAVYGVK